MSSSNKNNQNIDYDFKYNDSNDGDKSDKTVTYSRNQSKTFLKSLTKGHKILIAIAIILVVAGIVVGVCILIKNKSSGKTPGTGGESGSNEDTEIVIESRSGEKPGKGEESESGENSGNEQGPNSGENTGKENEEISLTKEDIKEIIKPIFKVESKEKTLNQIFMEYKEKITIKGNNLSSNSLIKAKFDIYVLSESKELENDLYSSKFTTSIAINSYCNNIEGKDCELEPFLDLTYKDEENNLRLIDENENIEEVDLPICIIEHTDTNIIISVSCSRTLEEQSKNLIISAFKCIKPSTISGNHEDEKLSGSTIKEENGKIYITSFSKYCDEEEEDSDQVGTSSKSCEINSNIITNKEGNLISSSKVSKVIKESLSTEYDYNFQDISSQNLENLNPINYKNHLDSLLEEIKSYFVKDIYLKENSIDELIANIKRRLEEEMDKIENNNIGSQDINLFNTTFHQIKVSLNSNNNPGLMGGITTSGIKINAANNSEVLSHNEINSNLEETINKFKILSNAGNDGTSNFYEKIKDPLMEINDKIDSEFVNIENILPFSSLSSLYDSTFAMAGLNEFPFQIVAASKNIYTNIKAIDEDLLYQIDDFKNEFNDIISSFLRISHNNLFNIFSNLQDLTNAISSKDSRLALIVSFYQANSTNTSYTYCIERANEILNNYYIKEKNLIEPLINNLFDKFLNKSKEILEKGQSIFDNITNRLEDGNVTISNGDENDIKSVIEYLYNSKIIENQIIQNIPEIMKKNLFKSNGYLVTQNFIEDNKNSYDIISENALKAVKNIDNNEYIDPVFDNIMKYFREQLIEIFKNIEKSKSENFPFKENILNSSYFSTSYDELEEIFKNEKINISNQIKKENKEFMTLIQQKIILFLNNNKTNLDEIITNIDANLSKYSLSILDTKYNELLAYTFDNITHIINYNFKLYSNYINDIKESTHRTDTMKNKLNTFINKNNELYSFIEQNLKNNLINIYKNIIIQIRKNLQSIKSNSIIKKYYEIGKLSFFKNHIREIDSLFLRLDDYISDKLFNTKYLSKINNYIKTTLQNIKKLMNDNENACKPINKKIYRSEYEDDIFYLDGYDKPCKIKFFGLCILRIKIAVYKSKKVETTNNINLLKSISLDNYSKDFYSKYNEIYNTFSNKILLYNNIVSLLGTELEALRNNYNFTKNDYLNLISKKSKLFLNESLGLNILKSSYNYYKNEMIQKLPIELQSILEQFKKLFNDVYKDVEDNINNFKYPINEFNYLSVIYHSFYSQSISYFYSDSIIEQRMADFNYTIKFYYNLFLSKINKTFTYLLNNIPINEKPFDDILKDQISEIKESYNEIINLTMLSQNKVLNLENQLSELDVSETNFFDANSFAVDLSDTIDEELEPLCDKFEEISLRAINQFDTTESKVKSICLENLENGKQIKILYDSINKGTFIEFQNIAYQTLFDEILEIDEVDFINKIKNFFTKTNAELNSIFEIKKDYFKNILKNEIFTQFNYTKNTLEEKINSLYNQGLNDLDVNSKNQILNYINEIINKIKDYINIEKERIKDGITFYSTNYNVFKNRLNDFKNIIYDNFNIAIFSVINDFYDQIKDKFYENYIKKNLDIYYNKTKDENFKEHSFLNITFNLKEIIDEDIEILTSEYKSWALNQINFLKDTKSGELSELFLINNLKKEINSNIDSCYNSILPTLKEKAIYNSGDDGISDYDFSQDILNNINSLIDSNLKKTKNLVEKIMKGTNFNIENNWKKPDFSQVKRFVFNNISNEFNNFITNYDSKELQEFSNEISNSLKSNFKQIINNFVPSFGKDYFDRILKYNEVQKIKSLYQNLKDSLGITLTYYIFLSSSGELDKIPEDLETKILSLNNLISVVDSKNNEVISILTSKFDGFLESTKNDLVDKYINYMNTDITIKSSFKENILKMIKDILNINKPLFGNEYINMMNAYIKTPFIEDYIKTIKFETNDMIEFIEENKATLIEEISGSISINKDDILSYMENKLNDTLIALKDYEIHFNSIEFPKSIGNYLNNYAETYLIPKHNEIKNILDSKTKNLVLDYLNISAQNFKNIYTSLDMELKINETNDLLKNEYFDNLTQEIKNYGTIESIYSSNLEKKIIKYTNLRRLEINDGDIANQKFVDQNLDKTFSLIKESSKLVNQYIENTDIFSNFENKVNKYIETIKDQYETSKNIIKERKYTQEVSQQLFQSLDELKELSLLYYDNIKLHYQKTKEYIFNSIKKIDNLIEKSSEVTYKVINDKYQEYKDNFIKINQLTNEEKNVESLTYNDIFKNENYNIQIKMNKIKLNNEFYYDIIFEKDGDLLIPKIIGNSSVLDKPLSFVVDFSIKMAGSKCIDLGKEITVNLNDYISNVNLDFDSSSILTKIIKNYFVDEYTIDNKFYKQITEKKDVYIGNVKTKKTICSGKNIIDTPEGEKEKETIQSQNDNKIEIIDL